MGNSIALITKYLPLIDLKYERESLTAKLDTMAEDIRSTSNAKTIEIATLSLDGFGDYSRANGYPSGDATLTWNSHTFSQDRARRFTIDTMDNQETANVMFGRIAGEFTRTKSVPEIDAYRFATYSNAAGASGEATLSSTTTVQAIDVGTKTLNEKGVPRDGRILYVSFDVYNYLKQTSTITRQIQRGNDGSFDREFDVFDGMEVIGVPRTRFYTAITTYNGAGEESDGGYIKSSSAGKNINFIIIHPSALAFQGIKHLVTKVISPEVNQTTDGWQYYFRTYHDAFIFDNKTDAIYLHNLAS